MTFFSHIRFFGLALAMGLAISAPQKLLAADASTSTQAITTQPRPKGIILLTVDDMSYDSISVNGGRKGLTPNLDHFASQAVRFTNAHVTSPICQPSRSVWMTGNYPHRNGAIGFNPIYEGVPTLAGTLRQAGWSVGIMSKNTHTPPLGKEHWDFYVTPAENNIGRDPDEFEKRTREFLSESMKSGKPFFFNVNIQDPHRPFPGSREEFRSRITSGLSGEGHYPWPPENPVKPEEAKLPPFLPDLPAVREEIAQYETAVHRADESVGRILKVLDELGVADDTLVMFVSDNGMAFPFAKATPYLQGSRTPWMVRWPSAIKPGVDNDHMIAGIDLMPTMLDAVGIKPLAPMDGRSFLPVLKGTPQDGFDKVFVYLDNVQIAPLDFILMSYKTRAIETKDRLYIWNGWSDGKKKYLADSMYGLTYKAMKVAAETDPSLEERIELYDKRVPEEFFDLTKDPYGQHNLADDPAYAAELETFRAQMADHLGATSDSYLWTYKAFLATRQKH